MVAMGDADGMVTGITRRFPECYGDVKRVIDVEPGKVPIGYSIVVARQRHGVPRRHHDQRDADARAARRHRQADGAQRPHHGPRAARGVPVVLQFRQPRDRAHDRIRKAIRMLDAEEVDFEYDGEMQADMALDYELLQRDLSVLPPDRPGQRADHARPALGPYLLAPDAAAGRRHGDRPGARSACRSRCRSCRWAPRSATSSTTPRSPPTARSRTDGGRRWSISSSAAPPSSTAWATNRKRADVAVKDGRIAAIGDIKDKGDETIDAGGLTLVARHRRRAHALRRAGHLGRHALALAVARRHHGGDGQLRLRHRAGAARRCATS